MKYNVLFKNEEWKIYDNQAKYEIDLQERLLDFTVKTIQFLKTIPYQKEFDVFRYQISKSASSMGANYEESQASAYREFHNRISICLREARETCYWYKLINRLKLGNADQREALLRESDEIKLIFGAIESKTAKVNV